MRVLVEETGLFTYPDVSVAREDARFLDARCDTLLNPVVIVEVLSSSTEGYDRGTKFANYRQLASLQAYILISQDRVSVEVYVRRSDPAWTYTAVTDLDGELTLDTLDCRIALRDVYEKVEFEEVGDVKTLV